MSDSQSAKEKDSVPTGATTNWTAEQVQGGGVLMQRKKLNQTPEQAEKDRSLNFILTGDPKFRK